LLLRQALRASYNENLICWGTSIGAGVQYGGIIGIQGTYKLNATKFRLAFGAIGTGASMEQKLTSRVTAGFQVFASGIVIGQDSIKRDLL